MERARIWPALPAAEWADTRATLHLWTQVVGKVRLALSPLMNHWWNVPLYLTARGLTTSAMFHGALGLEIRLDLLDHQLEVSTSDGTYGRLPLAPQTVAAFHARLMSLLGDLGAPVRIWTTPCELPDPIPFERDLVHEDYDREAVERFFRALLAADRVLGRFRAGFIGKASPVHFFWGSFDLAATLFSGRRAPERPGTDRITREAYSHEVFSAGFWPGDAREDACFYAYAAPEPEGFAGARVPAGAYHQGLKEFVLPYEEVRTADDPEERLLAFLGAAYRAAADLGGWDRAALERAPPAARPEGEPTAPPPPPTVH
ncbi:MAG TPA: DUF5996 family protein [Anaeromyxobacter sp.]|nr:DUF5996 family protein [Anaeromyxobacter sp.]